MEELLDNLWAVIAVLFWVLPGLIRFLKKLGGKSTSQPVEQPVLEFEEEDDFQGPIVTIPDEVDELPEDVDELKELSFLSQELLQEAETQKRRCDVFGKGLARLGEVVQDTLVSPLEAIKKETERQDDTERYFSPNEIARIRNELSSLKQLLEILADMIENRGRPQWSDLLDKLDIAAQELLTPYVIHARLMEIDYPTKHAIVAVGEADDDLAQRLYKASIASSRIDEKTFGQPISWPQLCADIALDVFFSTPGLARRIAVDLGVMPPPRSIQQYVNRDSFVAGLIGGWLPRLFAQTGAALQLGPALPAGLALKFQPSSDAGEVVKVYVGNQPKAEELPLHIEMFVACRVLQHLGMEEDAKSRWQDWYKKLNEPAVFTLCGADGRTAEIDSSYVLSAVARVVDYLIEEPQATLGGYPFGAIPGLACDQKSLSDMQTTAAGFVEGEPVDAPARVVLGASLLAVESSPLREMRIGKQALESLGGAGEILGTISDTSERVTCLSDMLQSRERIARAIVTGALITPRNVDKRRVSA